MNIRHLRFSVILLLGIILSANTLNTRAQEISLRNNLALDATLSPNIGMDMRLDSLWSVGIDFGIRPWSQNDNSRHRFRQFLISPQVRRWFSTSGSGHFVGADILYTHYNIGDVTMPFGMYRSIRDKRKQGDAVALGPFYGYSWNFASHWNLEAEVGVNIGYAWSKVYELGYCAPKIGFDRGIFFMPKIGVNIVYRFKGKK